MSSISVDSVNKCFRDGDIRSVETLKSESPGGRVSMQGRRVLEALAAGDGDSVAPKPLGRVMGHYAPPAMMLCMLP
jgi:hypothetical protein